MARKPLGVDKMGIQKTMRFGDYLADGGGQFALNSISGPMKPLYYGAQMLTGYFLPLEKE